LLREAIGSNLQTGGTVVKLLRSVLLLPALFSLSLFAQHGGGGHGGGGGGGFRGGGGYGGGGFRGGYGGGYGGFRGGYGGYGFRGYGYGRFGFGFGVGWPYYGYGYGYPYYGGYYPYYGAGYYDPYYDYGYAPAAPAATYAAPAAPAAPAVSAGGYYRQPDYYLIAFSDHNIRAAQSYQVIGDEIEWTPKEGGPVQRAPLSSVDKAFSAQINRDRRVKFELR
jgi:hypothetical protein